MKVTDIKLFQVMGGGWPRHPWVFVEVHTDEGITGLGEAAPRGPVIEGLKALKPLVIGESPFQLEVLWQNMARGANPFKVDRQLKDIGQSGGTQSARLGEICAIEMALWDIIGKYLGTPVYNLLGGRCYDRIRVYVKRIELGARDPGIWAENAAQWARNGFTALKIGIPAPDSLNREISAADLENTVAIVSAVKEAVGKGVDLSVDLESKWSVASALRLIKALEPFNLMWIENPIPRAEGFTNLIASLKSTMTTPLCLGIVDDSGRYGVRELLESRAADMIEPDLTFGAGGIMEMKKIAALADTYYVPVVPHNSYGPVATMASVHVSASMPNFLILETYPDGNSNDPSDVVWSERLLTEPIVLREGYIELPQKPGLGVELNREALGQYIFEVD